MRQKLLLHSCCGPCSTAVTERLMNEFDMDISVFYCNPCITDREEYELRKKNQIAFISELNRNLGEEVRVTFIEGEYCPEKYLELVRGLEGEPEGGARCTVCFEQRLRITAEYASKNGFDAFTTTLTVSPHKNYKLISQIANRIAGETGVSFLDVDFKKKDGFRRSVELSKEYGLYRQDFCGCDFSKRKTGK